MRDRWKQGSSVTCQVEEAGWDSGMGGMFDAAGICLFSARVFLLLLIPLAPDCLADCGG